MICLFVCFQTRVRTHRLNFEITIFNLFNQIGEIYVDYLTCYAINSNASDKHINKKELLFRL